VEGGISTRHGLAPIWWTLVDGILRYVLQLLFVLHGAEIAERRVPTAGIVPRFDVAEDGPPGLGLGVPAMAESFFATLEFELIMKHDWETKGEARRAIFRYIETWYNRKRRHSTLGYISPAEYEAQLAEAA
jgi:hypothetical protein